MAAFLLLLVTLTGCQLIGVPAVTAMQVANVADQHAAGKRAEKLWGQQLAEMREMQAQGDPMGDYLYALGNAQGWIKDTSDPLQIRDLFVKAAQEGSSDAKIVLGIFYAAGAVPGQGARAIWLPNEFRDLARGLALIREGMQTRCTYAEPVVRAYSNQTYLRYVSGAARISYLFRDGQSSRDAAGHFDPVVQRDARLAEEWHVLDMACRESGATSE